MQSSLLRRSRNSRRRGCRTWKGEEPVSPPPRQQTGQSEHKTSKQDLHGRTGRCGTEKGVAKFLKRDLCKPTKSTARQPFRGLPGRTRRRQSGSPSLSISPYTALPSMGSSIRRGFAEPVRSTSSSCADQSRGVSRHVESSLFQEPGKNKNRTIN